MIGICQIAFAQLRKKPEHPAELVSQILQGEWVKIEETNGAWCRVRTEHKYEGWTRIAQFQISDEETLAKQRISLDPNATVYTHSLETGFKDADNLATLEWNSDSFLRFCLRYQNIPYVWGGKTPNGLDCSGLVQLGINLCGFSFPRDAWQQAECGEPVKVLPDFSNLQAGDLLFFKRPGKKIHHVAVSLGGDRYLHASEWVRVNSLDNRKPDFESDRFQTLCHSLKIKETSLRPLSLAFSDLLTA